MATEYQNVKSKVKPRGYYSRDYFPVIIKENQAETYKATINNALNQVLGYTNKQGVTTTNYIVAIERFEQLGITPDDVTCDRVTYWNLSDDLVLFHLRDDEKLGINQEYENINDYINRTVKHHVIKGKNETIDMSFIDHQRFHAKYGVSIFPNIKEAMND
jgi:hypothetical protein